MVDAADGDRYVLDAARHQWEEGRRRLEAESSNPRRYRALVELVDAVADELRRRVGQTYTLADLAREYERAEDWTREVVAAAAPPRAVAGIADAALVQDAAFAQYALGAADYRP